MINASHAYVANAAAAGDDAIMLGRTNPQTTNHKQPTTNPKSVTGQSVSGERVYLKVCIFIFNIGVVVGFVVMVVGFVVLLLMLLLLFLIIQTVMFRTLKKEGCVRIL